MSRRWPSLPKRSLNYLTVFVLQKRYMFSSVKKARFVPSKMVEAGARELLKLVPQELLQRYTPDVAAAPFKANMQAWDYYNLRIKSKGT